METGRIITDAETIRRILLEARIVAVVGMSPRPERDSYRVGKYLQDNGYAVVPVRPAQKEILGERVYSSLDDIDFPVDIITVFRNPAYILPIAERALRIRPRLFWMQLGIQNRPAADLLTATGIDVIMNRCIKKDHEATTPAILGKKK